MEPNHTILNTAALMCGIIINHQHIMISILYYMHLYIEDYNGYCVSSAPELRGSRLGKGSVLPVRRSHRRQ